MKIESPIKLSDNFLRLQTAKIKENINSEEKYLSLLKKTSFWNNCGNWKQNDVIGTKYVDYTHNFGGRVQATSNFINICLNPIVGSIQFVYMSISTTANEQMLHKYELDNNSDTSNDIISEGMERHKRNDKLTRLSNIGLGLFYIATPIIECINTKSVSFEAINDLVMGSTFISIGTSQYLRHSDDKGLKNKKAKKLKGLEKLVFN